MLLNTKSYKDSQLKKMDRIIVSRADSIGDVSLTLPMCAWIKDKFPGATLVFLGKEYTRQLVSIFNKIDEFLALEDLIDLPLTQRLEAIKADAILHVFPSREIASLAKKARIPLRIGTSHRAFHLLTCNKRMGFTRKRSDLHEAQLNFHLLKPLGLTQIPPMSEVQQLAENFHPNKQELPPLFNNIDLSKTIILHPKSKGSAKEWPINSYLELCNELIKLEIPVIFTGTNDEGNLFRHFIPNHSLVINATGLLSLGELIFLISQVRGLVACSTGPYHIAGLCNRKAVGLFSSQRPMHPGRWHALGKKTTWLTYDVNCQACTKKKKCMCIEKISVAQVLQALLDDSVKGNLSLE
ncbi:MAG: glycosyltransferase family 9 protein [Bacteroidetes bacterium]|nr:glycosyltransferase family 9 protein [Bacteroidota bacterium]